MVIMAVSGQQITVWAKRSPVAFVAAFEAGHGHIIPVSMSNADGAQSMEVVVDKLQDFFEAFTRIAKQLANFQGREAFEQVLEARNGEQIIVAVGRGEGASERPEQRKAVIQDVEGFGFVAKVVLSAWRIGRLARFWGIGISAGLVGRGLINISSLRVAPGCKTTMLKTGGRVASAAFLPGLARRASTLSRRF